MVTSEQPEESLPIYDQLQTEFAERRREAEARDDALMLELGTLAARVDPVPDAVTKDAKLLFPPFRRAQGGDQ